jgi:hypothetical protein
VETRAEFAFRRQNSVALNAHGSLNSIYAAVFAVDGVTDVYATENVTNAAVNVGSTSYSVLPHSLYVAVSGGLATSVARAIWLKKDIGCDYNGNTSVIITDTNYSPPQPTYTVKFQTPAALPIKFAVQIATNPSLPSDIVARVQAAIIAAFTGADGGTRARIGATIFASRFYAGVATTSPVANIVSILLGAATPTLTSQTVGIDQAPTIQASDIAVTLV